MCATAILWAGIDTWYTVYPSPIRSGREDGGSIFRAVKYSRARD